MLFYHIIVALAATMSALPVLAAPMPVRSNVVRAIVGADAHADGTRPHYLDRRFGLFGIGTSKHKAGYHSSKAVQHKLKADMYEAKGDTRKAEKYRNSAAVHAASVKLHSGNYRAKHNIGSAKKAAPEGKGEEEGEEASGVAETGASEGKEADD